MATAAYFKISLAMRKSLQVTGICLLLIFLVYIIITKRDEHLPIDWKTTNVNTLNSKQIIDYFYWENVLSCKLVHDFGGVMSEHNSSGFNLGQKAVCLDPLIRPPAGNCIVYSFGINSWTFEESMEKYGCEVFAFDPSMISVDYKYSRHIQFFNLGLDDRDYKTEKGWKMRTLSSIYQMLGHGERVIDYLKMDIQSSEWKVLPQIISSGMLAKVRQLGAKFNLPDNATLQQNRALVKIIKSIKEAGMIRFDSKCNNSNAYEIAFHQLLPQN